MFCPAKHPIPILQKSNNIYCLTSLGCNENYIKKTDRNLVTQLYGHGSSENQPMHQHLLKCQHETDSVNLVRLLDFDSRTTSVVTK